MLRDEKQWPRPNKFDPDRFIDNGIFTVPGDFYIPFSLGLRKCIGDKLAMGDLFSTLVRFIQKTKLYRIELHDLEESFLEPDKNLFINMAPKKFTISLHLNE